MNEQLSIILRAEIDGIKEELNKVKEQLKDAEKSAKSSFGAINDEFQKVGTASKKFLAVAAGAITGVVAALAGTAGATKEYRTQQKMLATAFEVAGSNAETAKQTYNDLYRVLGDSGKATEAAQHLAKLTTNEKELAEYTRICQGVYATFGDSISTESFTEAINHTSKLGEVQGTLADALEWSGISVDDFNEQLFWCNSESEREKLIRDTLNGLYGEAADAYEVNAASILEQNEAQASLTDTLAKLGETMEPVLTLLTSLANDVLAELAPYIEEFVSDNLPQLKEILLGVAEAIGNVISWIVDNWEFVSTMAAIILGIAAAISVVSTVMAVVNAVMMASPVTWIVLAIVAAVAALVAIIVVCVKYWDEICAAAMTAVNAIWEGIKWLVDVVVGAVQTAWDWVVGLFSTVGTWIYDNVIKPVADFFVMLWEGIVNAWHTVFDPWIEIFKRISNIIYENVILPIGQFFVDLWNGIKNVFSVVGSWFKSTVIDPVVNFFSGMWNGLKNGAKAAWDGIKSVFSTVGNWFGDIFGKAWEKVKNVFSVGGKIFDGIKEGIGNAFKAVVNTLIKGINTIISVPFKAINAALSTIKKIEIVGIKPFDWIKTFTIPEIPYLEKGGIVDSATLAMIGERGKEAVVPLENNTEWLDMLTNKLVKALGGNNKPIYLMVDGKIFAKTAISTINDLTKQTGKLDLVVT